MNNEEVPATDQSPVAFLKRHDDGLYSLMVTSPGQLQMLDSLPNGAELYTTPAIRWVSDRDPPIDVEVVTLTVTGNLGLWLGDKDEELGDWQRGGMRNTHWLDGLKLP